MDWENREKFMIVDLSRPFGPSCLARAVAIVLAGAALALSSVPASTQDADSYPNKPVRIFVPFGAGGVGDLTMRLLAQKLSDDTGQQFVIENRPGAGGSIAARAALSAPADGYALAVTGNGQAIAMTLFKARAYDVLTDFAQVSVTGSFEMLLATKQDSRFKSLNDVVDYARKNPGKLSLGAINPGSTQNLSAHLFKQLTGTDVAIIPHNTTPDLVTALMRGDVDIGFDFYAGFQGAIADRQIRIVATAGETRSPLLKDVPTAVESGLKDYVVTSWNALSTRAGIPDPVLRKLNGLVVKALQDPALKERAMRLGIDARGSTPEEMRDRMARDIAKWRVVIEKANIAVQ
jgi:tripartite-type tricarboxylate transporter receptor subunit TctC